MFGPVHTTPSSHIDKERPPLPGFRHFESFGTQDLQPFAASDALCALRHNQPPVVFDTDFSSSQNDDRLLGLQTPSSIGSYQDISWTGRQPWVEPTFASVAPDQADLWTFNTIGHSTNSSPCTRYPILPKNTSHGYGIHAITSFPAIDQSPISTQIQQHTPPSETFSESPFDYAASSPPIEPASRSSTNPRTKLEFEVINDSIAMIDHVDKSVEKMNEVPYAKLIERALLEAKGNRLVLKDIYKWIEENTDKADNPEFKGWQNSVRHNLSMNGVSVWLKFPIPYGGTDFSRLSPKFPFRLPVTSRRKVSCGSLSRRQKSTAFSQRQGIGARTRLNALVKGLQLMPIESEVGEEEGTHHRSLQN